MFYFILSILIPLALFTWGVTVADPERPSNYLPSDRTYFVVWSLILIGVLSIPTFITSAVFHNRAGDVRNSEYVIEARVQQRDELLQSFDDVLDSEEFVKLMSASVPDDVHFLRSHPEVTGFLLGRADRIVDINQDLYTVQNTVLADARGVCSYVQNPFAPRFPFGPECRLGELTALFTDAGTDMSESYEDDE